MIRKKMRFVNNFRALSPLYGRFKNFSSSSSSNILFSGIQPTGIPHLGNYLGAISNWVRLQDTSSRQCIFSVVDLHSLTNPSPADKRLNDIYDTVVTLLACGIDVNKSILFQQSDVSEHSELCWILTCLATEARLKQVPQWKEKAKQQKNFSFGLIAYPLLMAADILLYKATQVPVGADQLQHIQLCRDLASQFNQTFDVEFFSPCEWIFSDVPRIRSLRNPALKMSKSDTSEKSRINLDDNDDTIRLKIRQAVTDHTGRVYYSEDRPGVSNLIDIHSSLTGLQHNEIERVAQGMDTGQYKLLLADVVIQHLKPIREKIVDLRRNKDFVDEVLRNGRLKANEIAANNLYRIKQIIGLK